LAEFCSADNFKQSASQQNGQANQRQQTVKPTNDQNIEQENNFATKVIIHHFNVKIKLPTGTMIHFS
jgi:hypothetical protein